MNKPEIFSVGNVKEHLANPIHVNVHSVGDHDHCSFFYVCKALNPEELEINEELRGFKWISRDELEQDFIPKSGRGGALKAFEFFD